MSRTPSYPVMPGWKAILAQVGVDAADVLRRAELPEDLLNRESARLGAPDFFRMSAAIHASAPGPGFWVQLTEAMSAEWFSPPLFAALCSPNLTIACERLALFKPLIAPIVLRVAEEPEGLVLRYRWNEDTRPPAYLHVMEALFVVKLARLGTREILHPVQVILPELPPDPSPYEDFLGTRLQQGKEEVRVTFSHEDARTPFLTTNPAMWRIFEPELRQRLSDLKGNASFAERTQTVLLDALPSGQFSMRIVARRLAVSSRTLQRRLREEGTTFKAVVGSTREMLAKNYLRQANLSATEIAFLLGFDEPTSFFRAFQRWTGTTPETVRRQLLSSPSGAGLESPLGPQAPLVV